MKAWQVKNPGRIDNLVFENREETYAKEGHIVVKVHSAALNPVDFQIIENGHPNWSYPHIPGVDLAGEVIEVGPNTEGFETGDRVACHTDLSMDGAFSEKVVVKTEATAKIPEAVSYDQAAAILCAGMTAYQTIIQKLNTVQKQTILIHAGAGGVGGYAIKLAKELGLKVFTTASPHNHDWVKSLGADITIDYNSENVTERIMEETEDEGVDLIVNTISSDEATEDLKRLSFSGQLAYIAGKPDLSGVKGFTLSPSIHEISLGAAHSRDTKRPIKNLAFMAEKLMERIQNNSLDPMVKKIIPRTELPKALKELKDGHVRGKIIVRMQEE